MKMADTQAYSQERARVAMKFFFGLMKKWACSPEQQAKLLGLAPAQLNDDFSVTQQVSEDSLIRISYLMGIHRALRTIFRDSLAAYSWVSKPNTAPIFGGGSALDLMMKGRISDLQTVRNYLDGVVERGGF